MNITRKDVAKYSGVSTATVSNVINNKDIVSVELREKVLKAIDELGYHPNMVARSLKMHQTMNIALVSNDITNKFFADIALGMENEARKYGYMVSVINANNNEEYIKDIIARQYDGVFMATDKVEEKHINSIAEKELPIVLIINRSYNYIDKRVVKIKLDFYQGAYDAIEYLVKNGHKNIGFIMLKVTEKDFRLKAYRDVQKKYLIDHNPANVYLKGEKLKDVYNSTLELLDKGVTAIFTNDYYALAVLSAIRECKLNIPEDISVIGCDNLNISKYYFPPLTTIDVPKNDLGREAMKKLILQIKGEKVDNTVLNTKLIIRKSVAPVKK